MEHKILPDELEWGEGKVKNYFGKNLLALENGTFKLVKANPNAIYPDHKHKDKTEFVYVLKGNPYFLIDTEEYHAKPNEFYIFPHGVKHAIRNKSDEECLMLVGAIKHDRDAE